MKRRPLSNTDVSFHVIRPQIGSEFFNLKMLSTTREHKVIEHCGSQGTFPQLREEESIIKAPVAFALFALSRLLFALRYSVLSLVRPLGTHELPMQRPQLTLDSVANSLR